MAFVSTENGWTSVKITLDSDGWLHVREGDLEHNYLHLFLRPDEVATIRDLLTEQELPPKIECSTTSEELAARFSGQA